MPSKTSKNKAAAWAANQPFFLLAWGRLGRAHRGCVTGSQW